MSEDPSSGQEREPVDDAEELAAAIAEEDRLAAAARVLASLTLVEDTELRVFARDRLRSEYEVDRDDLRRCRALMRAMAEALVEGGHSRWSLVRAAHAEAFGSAPEPIRLPVAAPLDVADAPSPWAKGAIAVPTPELAGPPGLTTTAPVRLGAAEAPALPFAGESAPPEPASPKLAAHPELGQTVGLAQEGPAGQAGSQAKAVTPSAAPGSAAREDPPLPLEKYASLCAELAASPEQAAAALAKYDIHSQEAYAELDRAWQRRLANDTELNDRFVLLRDRFAQWLEK